MKVLMTTRMVRRAECTWLDDDIDDGTMLYLDESQPPAVHEGKQYILVMYTPGTTSFPFPLNAVELYGVSK